MFAIIPKYIVPLFMYTKQIVMSVLKNTQIPETKLRTANTAFISALIFGLVSGAYLIITQFISTSSMPSFLTGIFSFILWCAKFFGCIWLMMAVMKRVVEIDPEATGKTTFLVGLTISFISAVFYAGISLLNMTLINPDLISEQMDAVMQVYGKMLDSNSLRALDQMIASLSEYTFFSNIIYCTLYGTVLSAILSRRIPSRDPFADIK